jgi:hypothetical protein
MFISNLRSHVFGWDVLKQEPEEENRWVASMAVDDTIFGITKEISLFMART